MITATHARVMPIVSTDIDRAACHAKADAEFEALRKLYPGIESMRVDTYTFTGHPVPNSDQTFDLHVKVIIVALPLGTYERMHGIEARP